MAARHVDEIVKQFPLHQTRVFHADHHAREQQFKRARRREIETWPDFAQVGHGRVRAFWTGRAKSGNQALRVIEIVIADPSERQIGKRHVVLGQLVEGDRIGRGIDRTFAGEDDTFGGAGRARRIENDRWVGTLCRFNLFVEPGGYRRVACERLAALLDDVVHRVQPAVIVIAQAPFFVVDHHFELGDALHHRLDFVDLLLVLDRGKAHIGVGEHKGQFVGHRVGVDGHGNRAQHLRGHHRPIELRPVAADDGDGLPALDAKVVQADGIGAHDLEHLAPRSRSARCRDPCAAWPAAPHRGGHCGSATWETCPRQRRHSAPQPSPPVRPRPGEAWQNPSSSFFDDLVVSI